ncbi:MAG: helix-turn-helix domain-containing protein [Thermostichales cyanobacterium GMQP_bins_62]
MAAARSSARQRILATAKELFGRQGITQTTTRQIAEAAGVHEVTLFRHFGSKQGLLLAVFADLGVFTGTTRFDWNLQQGRVAYQDILRYASQCFKALTTNPELVRSVVGEAGQYSGSQAQALQQGFVHAQVHLTAALMGSALLPTEERSVTAYAHTLHLLILGLAVLQVTCGLPPLDSPLWEQGRPEQFLDDPELEPIVGQWLEWIVAFWVRGTGLEDRLDRR